MTDLRVVESEVTGLHYGLVAETNRQPVACVLVDVEGHFAWFVSFLLNWRL